MPPGPLDEQLGRWVASGLIGDDQAAAIRAHEAARVAPGPATRVPVAAEVFGYLGACLAVVGAVLLGSRFWVGLAVWGRLAVLGVVAAGLWVAGSAIRERADPALGRLRGFLWLLSSAATAFFAGLLAAEVLDLHEEAVALAVGLVTAAHGGVLWRRQARPLQHIACLAGLAVAASAIGAWMDGLAAAGLAIWALGVAWVLLGWRSALPPVAVALACGALAVLIGPAVAAGQWQDAGPIIGLASTLALLVTGTWGGRTVLAALGVAGVFVFLPWVVAELFAASLGVPVAILASGAVLLGVTFLILRTRARAATGH